MEQEKNRIGRPPKLRMQEEIDKLRGSARDYAQKTRGESIDRELSQLLPVLREQGKAFPDLEHGERRVGTVTYSYSINDWFEAGALIIRTEAWGKTSRDFATEEDIDDESKLPFEERLYESMFIDALVDEFVRRAKKFHLTSPLVQFTIRVLQAALDHGRKLPAGDDQVQRIGLFFAKEQLVQYLAELKQSGDSYREPVKPRGKPGPKPRLRVPEHAGPAAYVTNADPDFSEKIADMAQEAPGAD